MFLFGSYAGGRWTVRPRRGVHLDAAHTHRGEFVRGLLQEQAMEERSRPQEGRADEEAIGNQHGGGSGWRGDAEDICNTLAEQFSRTQIVLSKASRRRRRRDNADFFKWDRRFRAG